MTKFTIVEAGPEVKADMSVDVCVLKPEKPANPFEVTVIDTREGTGKTSEKPHGRFRGALRKPFSIGAKTGDCLNQGNSGSLANNIMRTIDFLCLKDVAIAYSYEPGSNGKLGRTSLQKELSDFWFNMHSGNLFYASGLGLPSRNDGEVNWDYSLYKNEVSEKFRDLKAEDIQAILNGISRVLKSNKSAGVIEACLKLMDDLCGLESSSVVNTVDVLGRMAPLLKHKNDMVSAKTAFHMSRIIGNRKQELGAIQKSKIWEDLLEMITKRQMLKYHGYGFKEFAVRNLLLLRALGIKDECESIFTMTYVEMLNKEEHTWFDRSASLALAVMGCLTPKLNLQNKAEAVADSGINLIKGGKKNNADLLGEVMEYERTSSPFFSLAILARSESCTDELAGKITSGIIETFYGEWKHHFQKEAEAAIAFIGKRALPALYAERERLSYSETGTWKSLIKARITDIISKIEEAPISQRGMKKAKEGITATRFTRGQKARPVAGAVETAKAKIGGPGK